MEEEELKPFNKTELHKRNPDTFRYALRKMEDKGILRMDRHPTDGLGIAPRPPKSGHGGRFTWEGPEDEISSALDPAPAAVDPGDPNYVDEEEEKTAEAESGGDAIAEVVDVAKLAAARDGVSRLEINDPSLAM
ncbi:hypothetical protein HPP92_021201 [Vanilla planifolia]|uniref:Uncharacterized protein n=1 Tax=Vanilla planifolia TaxID=51239 RepID=A0A835PYG1_VANPL|nr:hypothetical protein HPP92_021571 [Vanilla planifolia]KAG0462725.1 hypothetical protein HPP92_021201 [Vanilla planifolia]